VYTSSGFLLQGSGLGKKLRWDLARVSLSQMRAYLAAGHFPAGSMGPKVEAAIQFLEAGGKRAIITSLDTAVPALRGETGTHIVHDADMDACLASEKLVERLGAKVRKIKTFRVRDD
jgi:hypothetical protein